MDDKKGKSLRKKRTVKPKISAPKQISGPLPPGFTSPSGAQPERRQENGTSNKLEVPGARSQQSAKTADLVKRRYSTRFTQEPNELNGGGGIPLPSVPVIPSKFSQLPQRGDNKPSSTAPSNRVKIDMRVLTNPELQPEQYAASILADASEQDILEYQQDLQKLKNRTSTDLQHSVYQNRTQFIKISKEAEKLKGEMRTLRSLMSDLTAALGTTPSSTGTTTDTITARRQANRSSVANLEALWNSQLQTLWKRVEGSQKFLPAAPGRHIVYESGKWVELNAATWKARRRVHLILLNDHLLVAVEKKRADPSSQTSRDAKQKPSQGQTQMTAQRCWPLSDVQLADLSTRSGSNSRDTKQGATNAINIRVGTESITFAVPSAEGSEKATFLTTFRRTAEELRKTLEADNEERGKAQDSVNYFATRDPSILKRTELLESLSETALRRTSVVVDVDGKQQNIRWVENQLDDLDIEIALQRFENAVSRVEKLKRLAKNIRGNTVAQDLITFKINERAAKLASSLTRQLVEMNALVTMARQYVEWLIRLGFEDAARDSYLEARSNVIKKKIRQCIFDGDIHLYIYQTSFIYFTVIKNTVHIYQSCFSPVMLSACVKWAKQHVDDFNVLLSRQLSSIDHDSQAFQDCMERAKTHASMLLEVGLDFKELVGIQDKDDRVKEFKNDPVGLGVS